MPPAPDPADDPQVQQMLKKIVDDHPGFGPPAAQGGMLNDYAPVNLPNDPTAQAYYQAHVPPNGSPPASPQQPPQEPAQPPAPAPPAAQPAASQPSGGLIYGKYKSDDEAQRGYWELVDKLKEMNARNTALEAANLHLQTTMIPQRRERETPPPQQPQFVPVQFQGDQPVVPVESFRQAGRDDAAQVARETVQAMLAPIQQFNAAQARVSTEFPEFQQRQAEFAQWLSKNPDYQDRVARDPEAGLELAYLRYEREAAIRGQATRVQATQNAQAQVDQARQAASASVSGNTGRRMDEQQSRNAAIGQALEYAQRTGDWKPYTKIRMTEALGEDFLNSLQMTNWGK